MRRAGAARSGTNPEIDLSFVGVLASLRTAVLSLPAQAVLQLLQNQSGPSLAAVGDWPNGQDRPITWPGGPAVGSDEPSVMKRWSRFVGLGVALGIGAALVPLLQTGLDRPALSRALSRRVKDPFSTQKSPNLQDISLLSAEIGPRGVTVPLKSGQTAELTLEPELQRSVVREMRNYKIPEAGVVLMDVRSGRLLVYASHVKEGQPFDVNLRAEAPAASIFKVVTGAALIERAQLNAETTACYHGGRSRILPSELIDDPARDKSCATLKEAMGRSLNVVFGKLARKHLSVADVVATAGAFGFGAPVPFVAKNEPPRIDIPDDPLEFARAAAGFWHTSLSPLSAVSLAQTVASRGVTLQPVIVNRVTEAGKAIWEAPSEPVVVRRAIKPTTAAELETMMRATTKDGSARAAFVDRRGNPYLPGIEVAGKTGTLTRAEQNRHYTWFVGFAPAGKPEVAVASLVVNTPEWRIKASELARDTLRGYFAKQGAPQVRAPATFETESPEPSPASTGR